MKRFYIASNRIEAYLLRDRLLHANITSHVFNEHMQSIVGDVPADAALPQVWLDDDADLAKAQGVLREYTVERERKGETTCKHCGERNPATFDLCWRCRSSL